MPANSLSVLLSIPVGVHQQPEVKLTETKSTFVQFGSEGRLSSPFVAVVPVANEGSDETSSQFLVNFVKPQERA